MRPESAEEMVKGRMGAHQAAPPMGPCPSGGRRGGGGKLGSLPTAVAEQGAPQTATFFPDEITGQARTSFELGFLEMDVPRVFVVLIVEDNIRLEMDFRVDRAV